MILTPNMSQLAKKRADLILLAIEDPRLNQQKKDTARTQGWSDLWLVRSWWWGLTV